MASEIISIAVLSATVLPDGSDAAVPNGWVCKCVTPFRAGQTFDPTQLTFTLTDPSYDATGTLTTITRTVTGSAVVRKQLSNQATRLSSQVSTNLEVYFAVFDDIYAGTTVAVSAGSAYYGPATGGTVTTVTNGSTRAYEKALWAWLNLPAERATSTSFAVELYATHRHGRNGRPIAAAKLFAKDAQATPNNSATVTVAATALSAFHTGAASPYVPEVFKATLDLTALTQGDVCQVVGKLYPWLGDATAVTDIVSDGVTWPSPVPEQPLRFFNDKTGAYGGAYAYVKSGASGGTVSKTAATARAAPFPTVIAALTALVTFNSGNGHSDTGGGFVRLMDNAGAAQDHTVGDTQSAASGATWVQIEADPSNTAAVRINIAASCWVTDMLRIKVPMIFGAAATFEGTHGTGSPHMIAFDGASLTMNSSTAPNIYTWPLGYFRNVPVSGSDVSPFYFYGGVDNHQPALILGCKHYAGADLQALAYAQIGNDFQRVRPQEAVASNTTIAASDGCIIANNMVAKMQQPIHIGYERAFSRGFAIIQNVIERAVSAASEALGIGADAAVLTIANGLVIHNTTPGKDNTGRRNMGYADVAGAVGIQKQLTSFFNLGYQDNCKTDTFTVNTSVTGRTGNWRLRYRVGSIGDCFIAGDTGGGTAPDQSGGNWLGEAAETGTNFNAGAIGFTSDLSGTGGTGGGIYSLTGTTNPAYARVPSGRAMLSFDIVGTARRNDGTGAAGAYERGAITATATLAALLGTSSVAALAASKASAGLTASLGSSSVSAATAAKASAALLGTSGAATVGGVTTALAAAALGLLLAPATVLGNSTASAKAALAAFLSTATLAASVTAIAGSATATLAATLAPATVAAMSAVPAQASAVLGGGAAGVLANGTVAVNAGLTMTLGPGGLAATSTAVAVTVSNAALGATLGVAALTAQVQSWSAGSVVSTLGPVQLAALGVVTAAPVDPNAPLTLAQVKVNIGIDTSDDDDLLTGLIAAAAEQITAMTGLVCTTTRRTFRFDAFPTSYDTTDRLNLYRSPVQQIVSVTYTDATGTLQTLPPTAYDIDVRNDVAGLVASFTGGSVTPWPVAYGPHGVVVTADVGYASNDLVPRSVRQAAQLMVAYWYRNRETATDKPLSEIPLGSGALLAPYRQRWLG